MSTRFFSAPLYVLLALTAFVTTSYAASATATPATINYNYPRGTETSIATAIGETPTF
ncbi:uncharacterized protein F5891DRAFT_1182434 [Suillus fuscotomentosus]|uniref:Uncharacterized protein n=1 Tax=Suillus fuscotomentosus TaxID=1912939 RepID=A0AAD4HRT0_9AGAM|nr:uncharacterized protein F5891DRAFT_1182434 [Suillus fuscotomentosus]KAG1906206.1 hypothetical protein F5891DRAFT_1182434 [Suillus fuscotomentosus]